MMESPSTLCPDCGEVLTDSERYCESCLSESRWKDLLSFRSDLSQLVGKFPNAVLLVDRCPTVRNRLQDWTALSSQLLTDLDDYFGPSDSCIS
jgi:hypothetical protein